MLKIETRKTQLIKPYENKSRINDAAVSFVANSIKAFGFRQPIVVDSDSLIKEQFKKRFSNND